MMSAWPESRFPTIKDLLDRLTVLVEQGFGDFPIQTTLVPDSTLQAIAMTMGAEPSDKPAIMIDFESSGERMPVSFLTADRMVENGGMKTRKRQ